MTAPELPEGWVLEEPTYLEDNCQRPFTLRKGGARICIGYDLIPTHYDADEVKPIADAILEQYLNDVKDHKMAIQKTIKQEHVKLAEQRRRDAICAVFGGRKP